MFHRHLRGNHPDTIFNRTGVNERVWVAVVVAGGDWGCYCIDGGCWVAVVGIVVVVGVYSSFDCCSCTVGCSGGFRNSFPFK